MKQQGYDLILCYGNEAEPQYVRYFSNYWPSFETAGVLIAQEGDPILLIGPESYTYASDRSKIEKICRLKAFRESSEPEYPGEKLDTFNSVFNLILGDKKINRIYLAPQMEEIPFTQENGLVRYTVEKLQNHQMVVLDYTK